MINRRKVMQLGALGALGGLVGTSAGAQNPPGGKVFRIAHLTDCHIQPERGGDAGLAACLQQLQAQHKPDIVLFGGDNVMDVFERDRPRAEMLFKLWRKLIANELSVPAVICIGNHDVWGWNKANSKTAGSEPGWGKAMATTEFGLPERYYSRDIGPMNLIVLDSTHTNGADGYTAKLDEPQFEWLAGELKRLPAEKPICVLSHIPIVSACAMFDGDNEKTGDWHIPGAWMHIDARKIKDLFAKHPNVRLALSGHIHLVDRVDYNGVTYLCNGAVSGAWWKGPHQECNCGYGLIDIAADGSFSHQYATFPWEARPE